MANQIILDRALDANGYVAAGAKATIYAAGTSTLISVYSDTAGTVAAANPVIADGNGFWPQRFVSTAAKAVVTDADDVSLYTLDPVPATAGEAASASGVSFDPTVELPVTNVQDAIEAAAAYAVAGFAAFGLGITGNAVLLADLDATNIGAGAFRFDGSTTGAYPTGVVAADTGLVETWRQSSTVAMMEIHHATTNRRFRRRLTAGAWGAWRENVEVNIGATTGDIIYRGASDWTRLAVGSTAQVLGVSGGLPAWGTFGIVDRNTLATTSGTVVDFTGITADINAFSMTVSNVSMSGSDSVYLRLGNSGGFVSAGYSGAGFIQTGGAGNTSSLSSAMTLSGGVAANSIYGEIVGRRITTAGHIWSMTYIGNRSDGSFVSSYSRVDLTTSLTQIRLLASGANTFDAGSATVAW